ncbi:MAG: energy transducer TonB [Pseudomonadota bacterium]
MTLPISSAVFDEKTAHPLRALPDVSHETRNRTGAFLVTFFIHVGAVAAFLVGGRVAAPILAPPPPLMVQLEMPKTDRLDLATPPPALIRPTIVTAPPPEVTIQTVPRTIAAAPPVTDVTPPAAAAAAAQRGQSEGRESFLGRLLAQLNRFKRYPPDARKAHIQGVVMLHFVMDECGHVTKAEIQKSSGRSALDNEALVLLERAQPLPALPADFPTRTLDAVVPIEFSLGG